MIETRELSHYFQSACSTRTRLRAPSLLRRMNQRATGPAKDNEPPGDAGDAGFRPVRIALNAKTFCYEQSVRYANSRPITRRGLTMAAAMFPLGSWNV